MQERKDADHDLERDEDDDDGFQERIAAAAGLVAEEAVHFADAGQFRIDLMLPVRKTEPSGGRSIKAGVVRIAHHFKGIARAVGQLEHVDDKIA